MNTQHAFSTSDMGGGDFTNGRQSIPIRISGTVTPWDYGAKIEYTGANGVSTTEHFALPPLVSRFTICAYNEIVRLINLNIDQLKSPSVSH